jgi:hypothetical protein
MAEGHYSGIPTSTVVEYKTCSFVVGVLPLVEIKLFVPDPSTRTETRACRRVFADTLRQISEIGNSPVAA